MAGKRNRFESEVQLGLLVIILLLLALNFLTNVIIYRTREARREFNTDLFRNASLEISRMIVDDVIPRLTDQQQAQLRQKYRLSSIHLIPSRPQGMKLEDRRMWFASIARSLPAGQIPSLAEKLLTSDFHSLTHGENDEYFYVSPVGSGEGRNLLILSRNIPDLAYLDNSQRLVIFVGIIAVLATISIYLLLYRYILTPFRKIRKQASNAGRQLDETKNDDVNAIVEEYTRIIEELQDKERQLRQLNEKVRHRADSLELFNQYLLESIHSGIITVNNSGVVKTINRAAVEMLALKEKADKYEGKPYYEVFPRKAEMAKWLAQSLAEHRDFGYRETTLTRDDERSIKLGVMISSITDGAGKNVGVSALLNDLSETEKLRAELETKNRLAALGEMAGGLAHQLRNSMGAIAGYGRLLKKRLDKKGVHEPSFESLIEETCAAEELTKRFLQFARPLTVEPVETNLREEIIQLVDSFRLRDDCARIKFVENYKADAEVLLDPLLFRQALSNLIENAINASHNRTGTIKITIEAEASEVMLYIQDYGCGIPKENMDKIFTPFFSSRPSGTGLGLSLAGKIIDLHKGRLSVISKPQEGTTFTITLPLVAQPQKNDAVTV